MRFRIGATAVGGVLVGGVVAATLVAGSGAGAADVTAYFGYAGGSQIRAANATISSDLSVQSVVNTTGDAASDTKHTLKLTAGGVLDAEAVNTSATVEQVSGGTEVVSTARTADVSLLGGLITADAVTTTSTTKLVNGTLSSTVTSSFLGLHIAGITLPVSIPQNYGVTIPGVASVVLNSSFAATAGAQSVAIGSGLTVSLLKAVGDENSGATVLLSPTYTAAQTGTVPDTGHSVSGVAYGTKVSAKVGSALAVTSDQTASSNVPQGGTDGELRNARAAEVNVGTALHVGAVVSGMKATNATTGGDSATAATVADISLLGGLIKADAITSTAHAVALTGKAVSLSASTTFAGLEIAGKKIAVDVAPNTTISLGSLGKVVLNEQVAKGHDVGVRALHVVLSTAAFGLDAGAELEVAVATATAY